MEKKKVRFCSQVDVYQTIPQTGWSLLKKQVLRDDESFSSNQVLSKWYKTLPTLHRSHSEPRELHGRLLQGSKSK